MPVAGGAVMRRQAIIYLSAVQLEMTGPAGLPVMFLLLYDLLEILSNFQPDNVTPDHQIKYIFMVRTFI